LSHNHYPRLVYVKGEVACLSNIEPKYGRKAWANLYSHQNINGNFETTVIAIEAAELREELKDKGEHKRLWKEIAL